MEKQKRFKNKQINIRVYPDVYKELQIKLIRDGSNVARWFEEQVTKYLNDEWAQ